MLLFAASVVMITPIFFYGIPNGNDLHQHYQFAQAFSTGIGDGDFYLSWSAMSNFGFGDVGIRFYPPFAYYVFAFFETLAGNWFDASLLTFVFWFFAGGAGVYFWAHEWFSENASLSAAIVYIAAPYHVNQIYNAFLYAEFAAAAILPFCFFFATRVCRNGKWLNVLALGIFYGLLILTHLPTALMGSIALLIYSIASFSWTNAIRSLAKSAVSVIVGLLLSLFYWVRMVTELNFLNHVSEEFVQKAYDFHINFVAAYLYVAPADYESRSLMFGDLVFVITLALFVPSAILYFLSQRSEGHPRLLNITAVLAVAIFFATPLSAIVWENFALLQKIQFPFRWMTVITLSGSIFVAAGHEYFVEIFKTKLRPLAILTAGLLAAGLTFTITQVIKPAIFQSREEFTQRMETLPEAKSYECWWTIWSKNAAFDDRDRVKIGERVVEIESWDPTERTFRVQAGEAMNARIATFYYPHWRATINDGRVEVSMDANGVILIPIPADEVQVKLYFEEPKYMLAATATSGLAWFVVAFVWIALITRERKKLFHGK